MIQIETRDELSRIAMEKKQASIDLLKGRLKTDLKEISDLMDESRLTIFLT